jgi:hypothetical protein
MAVMKIKLSGIWLLSLVLLGGGTAWGVEDHKTLQIVARIMPRVSLSLDRAQVTFVGNEDQPLIMAQEGPVGVTVKGRASSSRPLTLTMRAESELESPAARIPLQRVQWTAQGNGFKNGTLSRVEQLVGLWTASGVHKGQIHFTLKNEGSLVPGDYAAAMTLTLSCP